MGDEQTAAPVTLPQGSLAEIESQRLSSRAALLSGAIQKALVSKDGAPKAGKAKASPPTPKTVASPPPEVQAAGEPTGSKNPVEPSGDGTSESETGSAPADESESETSDTALAPELAELQALGKKKDLRALEQKLGLEEGSLGVNNGSWAAYRRRVEEVEQRETEHVANQRALIDRFGPPAAMIEAANKGDLNAYADLIERTTGVPVDKFVEHWAKNVTRLDPRMAELERENARLRGAPPAAAQQPVTAQAAQAKADAYIAEEAGQHPAFKLEGAKDGVRKIWLESYDKSTKGFKLTPQQAAGAFVAQRRAAYEKEQWILSGKKGPAPAPKTRTISRRGASETQPRPENLTRQQLIDRGAAQWRRLKATGQAT